MQLITTDKAPAAIGPYSQAVRIGDVVFCSGQIGIDPTTGKLAGNDVATQCQQVFKNINAVLKASGLGIQDVAKTTVFLSDMNDFSVVNDIYGSEFENHKPARSTVEVARLPMDALIEIECLAVSKK